MKTLQLTTYRIIQSIAVIIWFFCAVLLFSSILSFIEYFNLHDFSFITTIERDGMLMAKAIVLPPLNIKVNTPLNAWVLLMWSALFYYSFFMRKLAFIFKPKEKQKNKRLRSFSIYNVYPVLLVVLFLIINFFLSNTKTVSDDFIMLMSIHTLLFFSMFFIAKLYRNRKVV